MSNADPRILSAYTASNPTFAQQRPSAFRQQPQRPYRPADPAWSRYGESGLDSPYARRARWVRTDWTQSSLVPAPVSTYGGLSGPAVQPPQAEVATISAGQQIADLVTYAMTTSPAVATTFDAAMNKGPTWGWTPPTNTVGAWLRVGVIAEAVALVRMRLRGSTIPILQDPPAVRSLTALVAQSIGYASIAVGTSATHYMGGWLLSIGPQLAAQITGSPPPVRSDDPADMVRIYDWAIRYFRSIQATEAVQLLTQFRASVPTATARDKSGLQIKGPLDGTPFDPSEWSWKALPWWAKAGIIVAGGSLVLGAVGGGVGGIRKALRGGAKRSSRDQVYIEEVDTALGTTRARKSNPRRGRALLPVALIAGGVAISMLDGPAPVTDFVGVPMAVAGTGLLVARAGGKA